MHPSLVEMTLMLCYPGCKKELPAIFRTNREILSCTVWSQGTNCTSAVGIASADESVVTHILPGGDLCFHGNCVKLQN